MEILNKPKIQQFHLAGVEHILPEDAWKIIESKEAILLDVREDHEFAIESVDTENVVFQPLSNIMTNLNKIPKDKILVVICKEGIRSSQIVNMLNRQGFERAYNIDGGMFAWKKKGLPYESIIGTGSGCHSCNGDCSNC